jgi:hypothetical protein
VEGDLLMKDSIIQLNCLDLIRDCLCEYIVGSFYSQLTYKVITAFLINDKAVIHTSNGQTIIESGFEPSENIIERMKKISGNDFEENNALCLQISDWEITALQDGSTVHITQK